MSSQFSRSLPPRPDLAQQKSQAKELLESFTAGNSESRARIRAELPDKQQITLADAQFVLAREYGFTNWAELKQQILALTEAKLSPEERMRQAFHSHNASEVRRLFEDHAELRKRINDPIFSFD